MKKTALYESHLKYGAKIVEFAGWDMPVEYKSLRAEHLSVRNSVGIFDVSHMGEIEISGSDATSFSQFFITNDIKKIYPGQAQYTLVCNDNGGVIDDVIFYKFTNERYLICVNASNTQKDYEWILKIKDRYGFNSEVTDKSMSYSQIAVQGPDSEELLVQILGEEISNIKRFRFHEYEWKGLRLLVARTGYTGEDGFEIFLDWDRGPDLWDTLMDKGSEYNIEPCGLGCRDTLRIEAGYPLYGHEIDDDTSPLEAGLDRFVVLDKDDFVGKNEIIDRIKSGDNRVLIGFEMTDPGIPRQGYNILSGEEYVGTVTSGTHSPSLNKAIGMGLVKNNYDKNILCIDIRNKKRKIDLVNIPFYKK